MTKRMIKEALNSSIEPTKKYAMISVNLSPLGQIPRTCRMPENLPYNLSLICVHRLHEEVELVVWNA